MRCPRYVLRLLPLLALLCLPPQARATSVIAPEFDQLVGQADYIVRAQVKAVTSEWQEKNGRRHIVTHVTLDVKEVIAGTPPSPLVLELLGGRVGDDEMIVEGTPQFYIGDEDVLFIRGNGRVHCPLVAVMHGRYPVHQDTKSGRKAILRSNGVPLYDQSEVALPMTTLSAVTRLKKTATPLTPSEFIGKIRQSRR